MTAYAGVSSTVVAANWQLEYVVSATAAAIKAYDSTASALKYVDIITTPDGKYQGIVLGGA